MLASRSPEFWFFSSSTQELTGKSVFQAPTPSRPSLPWVTLFAAGAVFAAAVLPGCGDRSRRLSEKETLEYKNQLIKSGEISPQQMVELMYRPERTEAEIDAVFEEYRIQFAKEQAVDRAQFEAEQRATRETSNKGLLKRDF